ncbi:MAG: LysM peptidoglycan-binding domain-containing protein [Clostridia bacterium]|nr:LysM peptidoglycan-binding domain-containing protein [Clostridia bacterium]
MNAVHKSLIFTLASAMTVVSVACQNEATSSLPDESTPSYSELQVQSGVKPVETPVITTSAPGSATKAHSETKAAITTASVSVKVPVTTTSAVTTSDNTYRASLDRKIKDGKVVSPTEESVTDQQHTSNISQSNTTSPVAKEKTVEDAAPAIPASKTTNASTTDTAKSNLETSNSASTEHDDSTFVPAEAHQSYAPPTCTAPSNVYLVQENDCLWNIAEAHGITIYELAYANNIDIETIIIAGQKLIIPESNSIIDEILQDTEPTCTEATETEVSVNNYYIVVSGDSFYSIAEQFGITAEQLAAANGMSIYGTICPGDLLTIPSSTDVVNSDQLYAEESEEYYSNTDNVTPTEDTFTAITSTTEESDETNSVSTDYSQVEESSTSIDATDCTDVSYEYYSNDILSTIKNFEAEYVGTNIGMGIYSLDGTPLFEYNTYSPISGACTVKAAYAYYVLSTCEAEGIDIWNEYLTYQEGMRNDGSGIIKNSEFGSEYTISYLLTQLLNLSDNTAYNILLSRFSLDGYQAFLNNIGGQQLYGLQYGTVSVEQRRNEWLAIYNYINSGSYYSYTLQQMLTGTNYCYLVQGMANSHSYMHKSGWCSGSDYTAACDCAIIDNRYLVIVLSQDYYTGTAHTDIVNVLGREAEIFMG